MAHLKKTHSLKHPERVYPLKNGASIPISGFPLKGLFWPILRGVSGFGSVISLGSSPPIKKDLMLDGGEGS